mmetsp:Transcript_30063/g.50545  ORF Transcript_30063/g.50545 Transcript_30063/m.50545 type:complete len:251 (-) Transcript_30063:813-1565(-)
MRTPWCTSYRSRRPRRMEMVSSTFGWSTYTCWNRRSSAGSFSMNLRYSSSVVAPIHLRLPLASIGFSRLPASMAPSDLPAPTTVWISSMNSTTCPSESVTSFITAFSLSSNSPRNLAPAMSDPRSRDISRRPIRAAGTSPATMRWANASDMAVLPTPGSPMRTGLFFDRRDRIWIHLRISSSRPITGSRRPLRASAVRSRAYLDSASYLPSGSWSTTLLPPRTAFAATSIFSCVREKARMSPDPKRASST